MSKKYELINNRGIHQYEMHIDGFVAKLTYKVDNDTLILTHTIVPKEIGGRGIGKELVESVLEDIKEQGMFIVPVCSFVVKFIEKYPHWKELVSHKERE